MARLTHLECTRCGQQLSADKPQTICPKDGGVLYARYDLPAIKKTFSREQLCDRPATMWRWPNHPDRADDGERCEQCENGR
jgi:threonine synthase